MKFKKFFMEYVSIPLTLFVLIGLFIVAWTLLSGFTAPPPVYGEVCQYPECEAMQVVYKYPCPGKTRAPYFVEWPYIAEAFRDNFCREFVK